MARRLRQATVEGRFDETCWLARRDDSRFRAQLTITAMLDDTSSLVGFGVLTRDLSDRMPAEEPVLALLRNLVDPVLCADHLGRVILANRPAERLFEAPERALRGHPIRSLLPRMKLRGGRAEGRVELEALRPQGESFPAEVSFATIGDGEDRIIVATVRDHSDDLAAEERLRLSEERVRLSFEHSPIGMAIVDLGGRLVEVNAALCRLLGRSAEELLQLDVSALVHPEDRRAELEELRSVLAGQTATSSTETRCVRPDGHVLRVHRHATIARNRRTGEARYVILQFQDISEQHATRQQVQAAHARLAHQATHDDLTGLPNRVLLLERMDAARQRCEQTGVPAAVLFIDLDHFKWINDTLGHAAGDELLVTVADRLRTVIRPADMVARFGGDEFVVLLSSVATPAIAHEVAERLRHAVRQPMTIAGRTLNVTCSVGLAVSGLPGWDRLLQEADTALYEAKARGRDRWERFNSTMRAAAGRRMDAEALIREALDDDRVALQYQPVVDLASGRVVATEALARIRRSDGRLIPPGRFIDVAEDTGLIVPLGQVVIDQACLQQSRWRREGRRGHVCINVSAQQLATGELAAQVDASLQAHGLDPAYVCIELTESALIDAGAQMRRNIYDLRALGVTLALDDFGTGWSSLSYLRRFPLDVVKIDRSFVAGVGVHRDDAAVVAAVVDLSHALNLMTVAEGVETELQAQRLLELGCDQAQGYFFGRPADAGDVFATTGGTPRP